MDQHSQDKTPSQDGPVTDRRELLSQFARKQIPVSQHIVEFLHAKGITHVFGINGSPIDPILIGCTKIGIRVIGTRNQQSAIFASIAFNYMVGGIRSAAVISPGPALTNCTTGLLVAHDNQWPVLVISGRRSLLYKQGNFQELNGTSLLQPLCKFVTHVDSLNTVRESLEAAFDAGSTLPLGAALLDFNEDILARKITFSPVSSLADRTLTNPHEVPPEADLIAVLEQLEKACRPVLIAGNGLRWSADWPALTELVEAFSLPFVTTPMASGFLPAGHALNYTSIRAGLLANADLVLIAGSPFDWTIRFGREIGPDARIVFLHHDPPVTDLANVCALQTDSGLAMNALARFSARNSNFSARHVTDSAWLDELAAIRASKQATIGVRCLQPGVELSIFNWMHVLKDCIPEQAVTIIDGNATLQAAGHVIPGSFPVSRMTPGQNGCMGTGIPFACGARLATGRPVILITGDFAVGINIMEIETVVRHNIFVILIVINNSGNSGSLRQHQYFGKDYPEKICEFQSEIRYDEMMQAVGGHGVVVRSGVEMRLAIAMAMASGKPTLINAITSKQTGMVHL